MQDLNSLLQYCWAYKIFENPLRNYPVLTGDHELTTWVYIPNTHTISYCEAVATQGIQLRTKRDKSKVMHVPPQRR